MITLGRLNVKLEHLNNSLFDFRRVKYYTHLRAAVTENGGRRRGEYAHFQRLENLNNFVVAFRRVNRYTSRETRDITSQHNGERNVKRTRQERQHCRTAEGSGLRR